MGWLGIWVVPLVGSHQNRGSRDSLSSVPRRDVGQRANRTEHVETWDGSAVHVRLTARTFAQAVVNHLRTPSEIGRN